jgi:hypothetical protein
MLRLMLLAGLVVAAALFGTFQPLNSQAQSHDADQFIIGIQGTDGVIVPFAQYRQGQWLSPWPKPDCHCEEPDNDEPNTLTDQEKPWFEQYLKPSSKWYLSAAPGADKNRATEVIKTSKVVKVDSHCTTVWGLANDNPIRPDNDGYRKKRGVVTSADGKVSMVNELSNTSPDWGRVRDFIAADFSRAEAVAISRRAGEGVSIDLPAAEERNRKALSLSELYSSRTAIEGQLIYYFEARKEYPKRRFSNDESCNNYSILSGWIIQDRQGRLQLVDSLAYLTDCDMKEAGTMNPLGTLVIDSRVFVIVEALGYEDESYVIFELNDSGIHRLLETYAGGC